LSNLTGRTTTHRGIALRCPGCAQAMSAVELAEASAEVDVCDACGGMWLDWFDGEVRALATETLRVSSPDLAADASRKSSEPDALGACPRDHKQLVPERFVVPGQATAELLRCEECMGAFVARASAETLAYVQTDDEHAPESQAPLSRAAPLPWDRFVALLNAWLGVEKK
jgi:Zn-finger nucleic acid-binding protein